MTALDQARYTASLTSGWNSEISASRVTPGRMTAGCAAASGPGGGGCSAGAAPARNMTGRLRCDVVMVRLSSVEAAGAVPRREYCPHVGEELPGERLPFLLLRGCLVRRRGADRQDRKSTRLNS